MFKLLETHFPYCLKLRQDGRYVVLNRNLKPLGFTSSDWVDNNAYPIAVNLSGLTPKAIGKLSQVPGTEPAFIYLYDDTCTPTKSAPHMRAYLNKLAVLAMLSAN